MLRHMVSTRPGRTLSSPTGGHHQILFFPLFTKYGSGALQDKYHILQTSLRLVGPALLLHKISPAANRTLSHPRRRCSLGANRTEKAADTRDSKWITSGAIPGNRPTCSPTSKDPTF
ncbi:hypothetical protein MN608_05137 [Microdochium nivale]|nr:hypothetical protein MN608_05137 [Microdochium nivale]